MDSSNCINSTQPGCLSVVGEFKYKHVEHTNTDTKADVPMEKPVPTQESLTKASTTAKHGRSYPLLVETSAKTKVYIISVKSGNDCEGPAHQVLKKVKYDESSNTWNSSPICPVAKTTTVQYTVKTDGSFDISDDQQVPAQNDLQSYTADSDDNEQVPKKRTTHEGCITGGHTGMQTREKLKRAIRKPQRFIEESNHETKTKKKASTSRAVKENSQKLSLPPVQIDQVNAAELSFEIEMDDNLVLGQFEKLQSPKGKSVYKIRVAKAASNSTDTLDTTIDSPKLSKNHSNEEQIETEAVLSLGSNKFVKSEINDSLTERVVKTEIEPSLSDNQPNKEIDSQGLTKIIEEEERLRKEEQEIDEADASDDYIDITEEDSVPPKAKQKNKKKTAIVAAKKWYPEKPKRQHIRGRWKEVLDEYDYSPHYTIVKEKIVRGDKQVTRCNICDKYESNNLCNMKEHIRGHTGLKPFVCQYCNKSFHSQSYHLKHERGHLNIRPFVCEICHLSFKEKRYLEVHTNRHLGLKNYVCHVCAKPFYTITELKIHSDKHSDMKRYECPICEKKFRNSSSYYRHKLMHTSAGRYQCDFCGKTFHRKEYYIMHLQKMHSDLDIKGIIEAIPNKRNNFSVRKLVPEQEDLTNYIEMSQMSEDNCIVAERNVGSQTDIEDGLIIVKSEIEDGSVANDTVDVEEGAIVYEITIPEGGSGVQYITVHNAAVA